MSVLAKRRADYNEGHPATLPIADYLPPPNQTPFQDPVYFTRAPDLNDNEIAHFKIHRQTRPDRRSCPFRRSCGLDLVEGAARIDAAA